jgi:hypothetical protein
LPRECVYRAVAWQLRLFFFHYSGFQLSCHNMTN